MEISEHLQTPAALTLGTETPHYPLKRRLGGLQIWSGCFGQEKYSCPPVGTESHIIQPAV